MPNDNQCFIRASWETNKARFWRQSDGVKKKYKDDRKSAVREARHLQVIEREFKAVEVDGLLYSPLRNVEYDYESNSIRMEFVAGKTIGRVFQEGKCARAFYIQGLWLGLLHKSSRRVDGKVLSFQDYNRTNVILDEEEARVVAIDPGTVDSSFEEPSVALTFGMKSCVRGVIQERRVKLLRESVTEYVRGYITGTGGRPEGGVWPGIRTCGMFTHKRYRKYGVLWAGLAMPMVALEMAAIWGFLRYGVWKAEQGER